MGKSNRIKQNKQNEKAKSLTDYSKTKKKGMPNWAINLISIVVAVAILLSVAVIALSSSGIVLRVRTAMASENYKINGNMMKYYFQTTYQNFATNYESYMSYLSLDTSKSLKDQVIGDTSVNANAIDTALVGEEYKGKTWYDYFMEQTQAEVRNMLYYCEEADKRNISLDDHDISVIDSSIESINMTAETAGYTTNAYLALTFGKGITEKDVRSAMEISSLSSKAMTAIAEELDGKITSERIEGKYNENKKLFDVVDYTYYTFRINYSDIESEVKKANSNASDSDVLEAYKKAIAEAKEKATELGSKTDSNEFEKYYLNYIAKDEFDDEFKLASEDVTEGKPSDADLETIKNKMAEDLVKEIMEDKSEAGKAAVKDGDKYKVYDIEVTEAWSKVFDNTKYAIFQTLVSSQATYVKDAAKFVENDKFSTWAFDSSRNAGETNTIYTGDGSEEGKEITANDKYFYASAYLLRKTQYINTVKSRNVSYMLFSSADEARAAIDALKAESSVNEETFDHIAHESGSPSHNKYENYIKGDLGSAEFDKWLYDSATAFGSFTTTPISLSDGSYGVFLYESDGEEAWRVNVKTTLLEEDFTAFTAEMEATYSSTIKVNDKVCSKAAD